MTKPKRGGLRTPAGGRPKKEPTKIISFRVPAEHKAKLYELIKETLKQNDMKINIILEKITGEIIKGTTTVDGFEEWANHNLRINNNGSHYACLDGFKNLKNTPKNVYIDYNITDITLWFKYVRFSDDVLIKEFEGYKEMYLFLAEMSKY